MDPLRRGVCRLPLAAEVWLCQVGTVLRQGAETSNALSTLIRGIIVAWVAHRFCGGGHELAIIFAFPTAKAMGHLPMMLVPFPVRGFRATSGTGPGRYSVEVAR